MIKLEFTQSSLESCGGGWQKRKQEQKYLHAIVRSAFVRIWCGGGG